MEIPTLTKEQAAIIGAYTGILCGPFSHVHKAVEEKLGRPVWTHEFPGLADVIREAFKDDFLRLCAKAESSQ